MGDGRGLGRFLLVAVALATPAGATAAKPKPPSPGVRLARAALLRSADVGSAWTVWSPAPKPVPGLGCPAFHPRVRNVTVLGSAATPTFAQSSSGPFAAETTYSFAGATQVSEEYQALARPRLGRCFEAQLQSGSGQGVKLHAGGVSIVPAPRVDGLATQYRVRGTASRPGQSVDVYLDVIVMRRGRLMAELSCSSFNQPCLAGLEGRLARASVRRLGAA